MTVANWPFGELEPHRYGALLIDPPWAFKPYAAPTSEQGRRDPETHYATMSRAAIRALPVGDLAARDCHLFLWITGPMLIQARHLELFEAWGFKPSAIAFTWVKLRRSHEAAQFRFLPTGDGDLHLGLGFTTRKNCEFVVLGRRGAAKRKSRGVREIILSPARRHSQKPDEQYGRIEAYCDGPYAELFARERRAGWDQWGDQLPPREEG